MLLGGSVEERSESYETSACDSLGGVLPRCKTIVDESTFGGPREPLASEVDRSLTGDLLTSRRIKAPIDEARLGRVSSSWGNSISNLGSRIAPGSWCDTADNLSICSAGLVPTEGLV